MVSSFYLTFYNYYSEQKIETLKTRFSELDIPPFARWKEVESKLRADKDPVFISAEPLEQIT